MADEPPSEKKHRTPDEPQQPGQMVEIREILPDAQAKFAKSPPPPLRKHRHKHAEQSEDKVPANQRSERTKSATRKPEETRRRTSRHHHDDEEEPPSPIQYYMGQVDAVILKWSWIGPIFVHTGLRPVRVLLFFLVPLAVLTLIGVAGNLFCDLFIGILYPTYAAYKALAAWRYQKQEVHPAALELWLQYFVFYSLWTLAERCFTLVIVLPTFYYVIKAVALFSMYRPGSSVMNFIFRHLVMRVIAPHEVAIDQKIEKLQYSSLVRSLSSEQE